MPYSSFKAVKIYFWHGFGVGFQRVTVKFKKWLDNIGMRLNC